MMATDHSTETAAAVISKVAPPVTISLATVAGIQVSELVLWATLIYTILMIFHKLWQIFKDMKDE